MEFLLHWIDGQVDFVEGNDITDAIKKAGYGQGDLPALYFWAEVKNEQTNQPLKCQNHSTSPKCSWCETRHFDFECTYKTDSV